jgi:putative transposase
MRRSEFSHQQVLFAVAQAEEDPPVGDVFRNMGISEATFCVWKNN